jgi:hypothetical protein
MTLRRAKSSSAESAANRRRVPVRRIDRFAVGSIAAVITAAILVSSEAPGLLRVPAGAMLLLAPGYAWSVLVLPRGLTGPVERVVSTLALTLTAAILVSLGLYLSDWGLETRHWAVTLAVLGSAGVASERWVRHQSSASRTRLGWPWRRRDLLGALATVITLCVVAALARQPLEPPAGVDGYSQLWLVPRGGQSELGVASFELGATTYRLELVAGDTVVDEWEFDLRPNDRWTVEVPASKAGRFQANLYRDHDSSPYRRVMAASAG